MLSSGVKSSANFTLSFNFEVERWHQRAIVSLRVGGKTRPTHFIFFQMPPHTPRKEAAREFPILTFGEILQGYSHTFV